MCDGLKRVEVNTLNIKIGSHRENGYRELFNGKLRDEMLVREFFDTLLEAKVLIERRRLKEDRTQIPVQSSQRRSRRYPRLNILD